MKTYRDAQYNSNISYQSILELFFFNPYRKIIVYLIVHAIFILDF